MPKKYTIKNYVPGSYYHLFNRGVEKRKIFQDKRDYKVFLSYLKDYLEPRNMLELQKRLADPNVGYKEKGRIISILHLKNFYGEIQLLAFCLMPNHFHFLLKQKNANGIDMFIQSLATRYSMYFNKKYKRIGTLFEGTYKGLLVSTDEELLHLTKYIHLNPMGKSKHLLRRKHLLRSYSSYKHYLGLQKLNWVKADTILSFFSQTRSHLNYQAFIEKEIIDHKILHPLILD
jgi:putative transposase